MEVAGHRLGPGVGDADRRPAEGVVVEADPLHVGARVGAVGAVEDGRGARSGKCGLVRRWCSSPEIYWPARSSTGRARRRRPGPGPSPSSRRPAPTASRGDPPRAARRLERARRRARGTRRGPRSGCSRSRGRAARVALALDRDRLATVEEEVDVALAVAAGDDDRLRPERQHLAGELLLRVLLPRPGQRPGLGDVGGGHGRQRQQALDQRLAGLLVEQRPRRSRRPSPGRRTTGASPTWPSASTTASTVSAVPSIPILTASTPMSSATARTWATIVSGETASTALDPDRVLRGDRGDRRHPVHAAARERLQVGLDAGAAAGVGAGDREHRRSRP